MRDEHDVLEFGIANQIFAPDEVMNFLYGPLNTDVREIVELQKNDSFYSWGEWKFIPEDKKTWYNVPLMQRRKILSLIIKQCSKDEGDASLFSCFHYRIMCLLHTLLNEPENHVTCWCYNDPSSSKPYQKEYTKYGIIAASRQMRNIVAEVFLWWHLGVPKNKEEKILLRKYWNKIFGCDPKFSSQKRTNELVRQKVEEIETELKKISRIIQTNSALLTTRYPRKKKEITKLSGLNKKAAMRSHVEKLENEAQERLSRAQDTRKNYKTILSFLHGYLDFDAMRDI